MDGASLRERFPSLFSVSDQVLERVGDMGFWVGEMWVWDLRWKRG